MRFKMSKAILSLKDERAILIVKEAKKKAIDAELSFSDVVLHLLEKWVKGGIQINKIIKKK
jgi:hypothetical protein